jgi:hypothetical protein
VVAILGYRIEHAFAISLIWQADFLKTNIALHQEIKSGMDSVEQDQDTRVYLYHAF